MASGIEDIYRMFFQKAKLNKNRRRLPNFTLKFYSPQDRCLFLNIFEKGARFRKGSSISKRSDPLAWNPSFLLLYLETFPKHTLSLKHTNIFPMRPTTSWVAICSTIFPIILYPTTFRMPWSWFFVQILLRLKPFSLLPMSRNDDNTYSFLSSINGTSNIIKCCFLSSTFLLSISGTIIPIFLYILRYCLSLLSLQLYVS